MSSLLTERVGTRQAAAERPPRFGLSHWSRRPSLWMPLLALVLSIVPAAANLAQFYGPAVAANAANVFLFSAPAVAAGAAWEMSRFRQVVGAAGAVLARVLARRIAPLALFLPLNYVVAYLLHFFAPGTHFSPLFWVIFGFSLMLGLCWAAIGAALAMALRPILAVGIAAFAALCWYGIPPTVEPGASRWVSGDFGTCCGLDTVLDPRTFLSAALGIVALTLLTAGACALIRRRWGAGAALALIGALGLSASTAQAAHISAYGTLERPDREMVCRAGVCTWPELPEEIFNANAQAKVLFQEIAPPQWRQLADAPVTWGAPSGDRLAWVGSGDVPQVLGAFVEQATIADLTARGEALCGVSAQELGGAASGEPWEPGRPVDVPAVTERLRQSLCPPEVR